MKSAKEVDHKCSHHTYKTHRQTCDMMDVLINLIVINVLQCISVSNHHIVLWIYAILFVNYASVNLEKEEKNIYEWVNWGMLVCLKKGKGIRIYKNTELKKKVPVH